MGAKSPAAVAFSTSAAVGATAAVSDVPPQRRHSSASAVRESGVFDGLDRRAGGALSGALVGRAVLIDADAEVLGELVGVGVGECGVGAFDTAQGGGRHLYCGGQLGLGEAPDDAPVAGVALVGADGDDLLDGRVEDAHDSGQQVDLGCALAGFPVEECGRGDLGQSGEVADVDAAVVPGLGECGGIESAQDAAGHARPFVPLSIVEQIHRVLLKSVNVGVLYYRLSLEYGFGNGVMTGEDSLKQPRLPRRPLPQIPAVQPCVRPIPGLARQPDRAVRIAYWWATSLQRHGWALHACGDDIAGNGFIAHVPGCGGQVTLMIYPADMADDGTAASALARHLGRLGSSQRRRVQRIIAEANAGRDQVL